MSKYSKLQICLLASISYSDKILVRHDIDYKVWNEDCLLVICTQDDENIHARYCVFVVATTA